jgi:hypothetical protein
LGSKVDLEHVAEIHPDGVNPGARSRYVPPKTHHFGPASQFAAGPIGNTAKVCQSFRLKLLALRNT